MVAMDIEVFSFIEVAYLTYVAILSKNVRGVERQSDKPRLGRG